MNFKGTNEPTFSKFFNAPIGMAMVLKDELKNNEIAIYDPDRKGIFIHKDQLASGPFKSGDRFSLRTGKQQIFAITIVKDDEGDIVFDQNGIFIQRTRKIDVLLGGIFDDYVVYIEPDLPDTIKIRPLEKVKDMEQKWF